MTRSKSSERMDFEISVLRLGHRLVRDTRMSTHAALVSRALGAREIIMSGAEEDDTIDSTNRVNARWGGQFKISHIENWREIVKHWDGVIVHLTMYGEQLDQLLPKIRRKLELKSNKLLLIIGAEKVPREIYALSHFNVAIGNQPHSEVAALAIFLDRIYKGKELYSTFENAKIRIIPSSKGKEVVNQNEN
ncbi:MAG: tRNA (cytidine(56)-2'-O)-methyltransferase [archaeon]|nr:tRNA (cytidine(56)-2'-O)-methyltransferase [archaeon]